MEHGKAYSPEKELAHRLKLISSLREILIDDLERLHEDFQNPVRKGLRALADDCIQLLNGAAFKVLLNKEEE